MSQHTLMQSDPATGAHRPYPSHAAQWREYHGAKAWLFNPWTVERRDAADVGTDTFGLLIVPPREKLKIAIDCSACGATWSDGHKCAPSPLTVGAPNDR